MPLGTVCFQCRWVLYVSGAVEHYHFVTAVGFFSLPSIEGILILLAASGPPLPLTTVLLLLLLCWLRYNGGERRALPNSLVELFYNEIKYKRSNILDKVVSDRGSVFTN